MLDKKDVTIIIPTMASERNEYALNQCLTSLLESGFPPENIIVAVNGLFTDAGQTDKRFKVVWVEEQGQCKAVNAAVATANTPWIMVTNDDMVYPPDWFERLVEPIGVFIFDAEKGLSVSQLEFNQEKIALHFDASYSQSLLKEPFTLSPQLIEPRDGAPTFKKVFFGGIGGDWNKDGFMEYAKIHEGQGVRSGFNLPFLMKKEVWDLIGGYDVNYDPWGSNSDSDLQYKLKLAGVKMYQNTDCPVYHFSNTSDTFVPENRGFWQKNWEYFIEKWGFERTDNGIWEATFEIPMDKLKFCPIWKGFFSRRDRV